MTSFSKRKIVFLTSTRADFGKIKSLINNHKAKIKFVKDRPGHDFRYALNSDKIKKELDWKAKISLNKGLTETFYWYLNNNKSKIITIIINITDKFQFFFIN